MDVVPSNFFFGHPCSSDSFSDDSREYSSANFGGKPSDFSPEHDLIVQSTLLRACGQSTE
ncbi:MAG: hypothetical protein FJ308_13270 [Planctomycetes bacterium]|nr:hypothetical protein [Planctomycetota bacterium]